MYFLKWIWKKWLPIAHAIGNFQAQVILSAFYVIILSPVGVLYRIFADPFKLRKKLRSNFGKWEYAKDTLESAHRQY
jgi:hypothetical protein